MRVNFSVTYVIVGDNCTKRCLTLQFTRIHAKLCKFLGHHLVKPHKMLSGKEFWQSLACFVTGGIITVILIKMLERKRDGNKEEQGDRRILIPVQEVGDGEREVERVVPALTTNIRKFPQEQDEF